MIDLLLFAMVAPWVVLISATGVLLIIELFKGRKND